MGTRGMWLASALFSLKKCHHLQEELTPTNEQDRVGLTHLTDDKFVFAFNLVVQTDSTPAAFLKEVKIMENVLKITCISWITRADTYPTNN